MHPRLQQLHRRYLALSLRERALVTLSILVALVVGWNLAVFNPMYTANTEAQAKLAGVEASLKTLQQQQQQLLQKQQQDPLRELKDRVALLDQHLAEVNRQLQGKLHGLIAPPQMAKLLESALQQQRELKLIKLQSLAAVPLVLPEEKGDKAEVPVKKPAQVYRHGLQLEFEGSYLATLEYLKALQGLPWEFYWDEVSLQVDKYPLAHVTIVVHTLSLTEGWIGV